MIPPKLTVATILEKDLAGTIDRWMGRVNDVPALTTIALTYPERTGHLPRLIQDVISRLRLDDGQQSPETTSAHDHGKSRFEQGYSLPMLVEESRLLQVSIFDTLHRGQDALDFQVVLRDVMTIADECDAQLKHTVETFMELEKGERGPILVVAAS
jgi:hypothetical protein